jgi:SAM-dependent methyltransferase
MLTIDFNRLGVRPGMRVLDAGCGQGRHSLEVLRRGAQAVALDLIPHDLKYTRYLLASMVRDGTAPFGAYGAVPSGAHGTAPSGAYGTAPPMVHTADSPFAHALLAAAGEPVPTAAPPAVPSAPSYLVLRGNTLRLPFPDASFDRVLCSEVLEHVADPAQAMAELVRVLRPGGLFAASVPTPFSERIFHFGSDEYFNSPGGHVRIFTARRLLAMLGEQGLKPADLHFEHAFHTIYWWVRCVFGLHDEGHPVIRHFKKVLTHILFSPALCRAETVFDWVFPKSMVVYAVKGQ